MMQIGSKIRKIRENKGLSQSALARLAGISNDYMNKIELDKVKNVGLEKLSDIAEALEIHISELIPQKSPTTENVNTPIKPIANIIPIVGYVNAGKGKNNISWDNEGLPCESGLDHIEDDDIKDPNAYALVIRGDSMPPFDDKKWHVVVEPNREWKSNELVVARLKDNDVLFKKIKVQGDLYILQSSSSSHEPIILNKSDFISIHRVGGVFQI